LATWNSGAPLLLLDIGQESLTNLQKASYLQLFPWFHACPRHCSIYALLYLLTVYFIERHCLLH
jgi:hypothetical protein